MEASEYKKNNDQRARHYGGRIVDDRLYANHRSITYEFRSRRKARDFMQHCDWIQPPFYSGDFKYGRVVVHIPLSEQEIEQEKQRTGGELFKLLVEWHNYADLLSALLAHPYHGLTNPEMFRAVSMAKTIYMSIFSHRDFAKLLSGEINPVGEESE